MQSPRGNGTIFSQHWDRGSFCNGTVSCLDLPRAVPLHPARPALRAPHRASLGWSLLDFLLPPLSLALFSLFLSCPFLLQHFALGRELGGGAKMSRTELPPGRETDSKPEFSADSERDSAERKGCAGHGEAPGGPGASLQPPGLPQSSHLCSEPADTSWSLGPQD